MTYTKLFSELVRAEIELWNSINTHLTAATPLSLPQFQALAAIAKFDGSARVMDISLEMSITVGAASKVVDRLERDGHAVRQSNPDDRRSSIVKLTKGGLTSFREAETAVEQHLSDILGSSLGDSEVTELSSQLEALRIRVTS